MIVWRKQGKALVGEVSFTDGRHGSVVLVGARDNPKGAALVLPAKRGENPEAVHLPAALDLLRPADVVDVLCAQERCFGDGTLPELDGLSQ